MKIYIIVFGCVMLLGCRSLKSDADDEFDIIRIKGSDSMLLLVRYWADEFMRHHNGVLISVEGGGSGTGIQHLMNGTIDICSSSRPLTAEEITAMSHQFLSIGYSLKCARDALSIIVHPSNPVADLSLAEVSGIFSGRIIQWNEVGGPSRAITVYTREPNSGSYLFFKDHAMEQQEYSERSHTSGGAMALVRDVALDSSSIGYSTFAYTADVKNIAVEHSVPAIENVRNGTYPISRYLFFYTIHPPEGIIKDFLDWVISPEGQRIAEQAGYFPVY